MLIFHKGHTDTIQVYSVTVMTHVKALQAGHSSHGTSEPITPAPSCKCPIRTSSGTVDSTIGQLRAIFREAGRGTDWVESIGVGNPAASTQLKKHLKSVQLEQADAQVEKKKG